MSLLKNIISSVLKVSETSAEIAEMRMATCRLCTEFDAKNIKCTVCGCYVEIKSKLDFHRNPKNFGKIEKTHCPQGKWAFADDLGIIHLNDKEIVDYYTLN